MTILVQDLVTVEYFLERLHTLAALGLYTVAVEKANMALYSALFHPHGKTSVILNFQAIVLFI